MTPTALFSLILGISLLLFGRRLFWLFVGVAGFIAGLTLAPQMISSQSELVILFIAIIFGIIGAFLAIFLEGLAILIAGFLAGGYLMTTLVVSLGASVSADPSIKLHHRWYYRTFTGGCLFQLGNHSLVCINGG
jgi:hypothetical protein